MRYKKLTGLLFFIALLINMGGCGEQKTIVEEIISPYAVIVSMENTPVVDYIVPQISPNILIDLKGYLPEDEKMVFVKGQNLPEEFRLIQAKTKECVYIGRIEDITYHEDQGLYCGTIDFSDFQTEGAYYLECDIIGQSHRFVIENQMYLHMFQKMYEQYMERCQKNTLSVTEAVALLEAYEWYPDLFPDEDRDEVPDVLKEIRGWVAYCEESGINKADEAKYAALLAKFSYLYQKFDHVYATDCLQRASTVYGQQQTVLTKDADSFFALTELYRATGLYTYRNQITEYKSFFENNSSYLSEKEYLYAVMTYMATRQKVDVNMCEAFMGKLLDYGEELCNCYREMVYPLEPKNNGTADLVNRAVEVSCANYVMNNYQYTKVTESILHYLLGCNMDSLNLFEQEENAEYIILLAQLTANHSE